MPSWVRRVPALLAVALVAALMTCVPGRSAAAEPAPTPTKVPGPVVVVGLAGMTWQDVDEQRTPTLWQMTGSGAAGAMTVRVNSRLTCPIEAWLTISSGSRALMPASEETPTPSPSPSPSPTTPEQRCSDYPGTVGSGGDSEIEDWRRYRVQNAQAQYGTKLGTVPGILRRHDQCIGAVGAGAVLGSAAPDGQVTSHRGSLADLPALAEQCPLVYVDAGVTPTPAEAEATTAAVQRSVPDDATLIVLGLSDRYDYAQMHVAIASGPNLGNDPYAGHWLGSASTRRDDVSQLTDVAPTLLTLLGHDDERTTQMTGSPLRATTPYDGSTADVVRELQGIDKANKVSRDLTPGFVVLLELVQAVLFVLAAVGLRRWWPWLWHRVGRRRILVTAKYLGLVAAAVLPATFLANLVPWWNAGLPKLALLGTCALFTAATLGVALAGPWRRHVIGPPTAIAAVTGVALGADVLTGSNMQLSSMLGYPVVIAARFYGFGNNIFALFATGVLLFLAGLYHWTAGHLRKRWALVLVAALGGFAVVLDGWPSWGSDFGGVIAFVPGVLVLLALLAGRTLNLRWLAGIAFSGVVAVAVIAYLDFRRPAQEQSHLGRFVGQTLNGEALEVIARKLRANLTILVTNLGLTLLVIVGIVFFLVVLMRPFGGHEAPLQRVYERVPAFRAGVAACAVTLGIGMLINDSGIAIPAMGMMLGLPLVIAASITLEEPVGGDRAAEPRSRLRRRATRS